MGCVAQTAKRRRRQAKFDYRYSARGRRSVERLRKRDMLIIERQKAMASRKGSSKK
jgi:hypothetical protein